MHEPTDSLCQTCGNIIPVDAEGFGVLTDSSSEVCAACGYPETRPAPPYDVVLGLATQWFGRLGATVILGHGVTATLAAAHQTVNLTLMRRGYETWNDATMRDVTALGAGVVDAFHLLFGPGSPVWDSARGQRQLTAYVEFLRELPAEALS